MIVDTGDVFLRALNSWLACKPYEILIVTVESCRREMEDLIAKSNGGVKIGRGFFVCTCFIVQSSSSLTPIV
jgi:hypothetical protein